MAPSISNTDVEELTWKTTFLRLVPSDLLATIRRESPVVQARACIQDTPCPRPDGDQQRNIVANSLNDAPKPTNQMLLIKPEDSSIRSPFLMLTNDEELVTSIALQPPSNLECNDLSISQFLRDHHERRRARARDGMLILSGADDFELTTLEVSSEAFMAWPKHFFSKDIKRIESSESMIMEHGVSYENSMENSTVVVTRPLPSPAPSPCDCMCLMVKHVGECCQGEHHEETGMGMTE